MNLRQEVTKGAREFDADTTPTCPHLSDDWFTRGKQIRAVAIDRLVKEVLKEDHEVPSFDLGSTGQSPDEFLVEEATDLIIGRCRDVLEEYDCEIAQIYVDSFIDDEEDGYGLPTSPDEITTICHLGGFIKSGIAFPISIINLVNLSLSDYSADELYQLLLPSYPGCIKKFTGGKSILDLNFANSGIAMHAEKLVEYVKPSDASLSLKAGIIKAAKDTTRSTSIKLQDDEDRSALCPASIDISNGYGPVVAEKFWRWTVEVARNSELIQALRDQRSFY